MPPVSDILAGTPAWVWVLLVFLVYRGIQASRPGVVQFWRLLILPVVFGIWGIYSVLTEFTGWLGPAVLAAAFAVGMWLGAIPARSVQVRADRQRGLIGLPGSWGTLVYVMVIFVAKYVLGATLDIHPPVAQQAWFVVVYAGIDGFLVGMFAGQLRELWRKYQVAPPLSGPAGV